MIFKKDDDIIEIATVKFAGKKPSLFIGKKNSVVKIASFRNEDAAKLFIRTLEEFLDLRDEVKENAEND